VFEGLYLFVNFKAFKYMIRAVMSLSSNLYHEEETLINFS
jgi:uncharacterized protein YjeT (DUF2065 family)